MTDKILETDSVFIRLSYLGIKSSSTITLLTEDVRSPLLYGKVHCKNTTNIKK